MPDPTARDAASLAVGYQVGDSANWLRASVGLQYRPEEGHHSIGPNQWESHPALVAGGHLSAQWTPLQADFNPRHRTETRVGANLTGGLAFTDGGGSNASGGTHDAGWGLNNGLSAGLGQASLRLGQHFSGELSNTLSYQSEVFINPDIMAAAYGYSTGGSGLYANTGVNGSLHYQNDNWNAHVGGQYLFSQVNNLEATGVNAGLGYQSGRLGIQTQAGMLDSPEGWRLQTRQQVNLNLTDKVQAFGYATQEQVFNDTHGRVNLNAGNQFGLGLRANF
ncbi:MAG: hypothetical protein IGS03_10860 [Candidatus Sericytochromatia bacterium]|nr:hypothetical protein [Candidatus Sericytochromatia bacterium]